MSLFQSIIDFFKGLLGKNKPLQEDSSKTVKVQQKRGPKDIRSSQQIEMMIQGTVDKVRSSASQELIIPKNLRESSSKNVKDLADATKSKTLESSEKDASKNIAKEFGRSVVEDLKEWPSELEPKATVRLLIEDQNGIPDVYALLVGKVEGSNLALVFGNEDSEREAKCVSMLQALNGSPCSITYSKGHQKWVWRAAFQNIDSVRGRTVLVFRYVRQEELIIDDEAAVLTERKHYRIEKRLPCEVMVLGPKNDVVFTGKGRTNDLSLGGVSLDAKIPCKVNDKVRVKFSLWQLKGEFDGVVRSFKMLETGEARLGISFSENMPLVQKETLAAFIKKSSSVFRVSK